MQKDRPFEGIRLLLLFHKALQKTFSTSWAVSWDILVSLERGDRHQKRKAGINGWVSSKTVSKTTSQKFWSLTSRWGKWKGLLKLIYSNAQDKVLAYFLSGSYTFLSSWNNFVFASPSVKNVRQTASQGSIFRSITTVMNNWARNFGIYCDVILIAIHSVSSFHLLSALM